jgi:hypothetical protein
MVSAVDVGQVGPVGDKIEVRVRARAAQGGVTLGLEQGELEADL